MKLNILLTVLSECLNSLAGKICYKKGTVKAFKSYERKARSDFQKTNGVRLTRNQRILESELLKIRSCDTVDTLINQFKCETRPEGYVKRFAYICDYYEHINVESV